MANNNQNYNAGKTTAAGTNAGKVKQQNQAFGQEFASEATDAQAVRQANAQSAQKAASKNFGQQNQQ
ncbi:gamma-type small acid-soluble spore protein [Bacillus sp. EAC]|uniref:gamma-type small acid-soluble spore protein n=1 Tax=Bacillus sp. EAC TaxID=1978338 RepID=UPI000B44318A|nr:gamma-type small acid-soluble spore protein [Bacillus sp. EAC]